MIILLLTAIKVVEVGVAGIVVSNINHGARQLDYTPATTTVLEEVKLALSLLLSIRLFYSLNA